MKKTTRRPQNSAARKLDELRAFLVGLFAPHNAKRAPSLFLKDLLRVHSSPGPDLASLVADDADESVRQAAIMMLFVAAKDPGVPVTLSKLLAESARATLLRGLRDPAVSDERKYELGPLLEACGGELEFEEYRACFRDFETTTKKKSHERIAGMSDSIESIEAMLSSLKLIDHGGGPPLDSELLERAFPACAEVAEHNPSVAAIALGVFAAVAQERGFAADLALAALDIAASTRHPRAAWILGELGRWPAPGPVGATAAKLAEELTAGGIVAKPPLVPEFSHGYVTGMDGAGSRSVMLFFKRGDGALDALSFLLNDQVGLKDVWPVFGEGADVEAGLRGLTLPAASCDLAFARALVADALAKHAAIDRPVPGRFALYRPLLGTDPLLPAARRPDLGAYLLETVVRGPALVEGSEALLDHPLYGDLWPCGEDSYAFVRAIPKMKGRRSAKAKAQLIDDFLAAVAAKEGELLAHRLATNLEVEARGGRAKKPLNKVAASVFVALTDRVVPFERIPYARGLAEHALDSIKRNLELGYRSQAEANSTAFAMEADASKFLSGLLDDRA